MGEDSTKFFKKDEINLIVIVPGDIPGGGSSVFECPEACFIGFAGCVTGGIFLRIASADRQRLRVQRERNPSLAACFREVG